MSFQPLGIAKQVTDGKVEIPLEMLEAAGLVEGSNVEVFANKGTVFIRTIDYFCDICEANGKTTLIGNKHLCDNCIDDISKINTNL